MRSTAFTRDKETSVVNVLCGESARVGSLPRRRSRKSPRDGGMRMEPPLHPRRGRALGQVLLGEFIHGGDERSDAGDGFKSIAVCLALVVSRKRVQRRHQKERKQSKNQDQ